MLQERNQGCGKTHNLVRRHVHEFYFFRIKDREVTCLTALDLIFNEVTLVIQRDVCLGDPREIFFFSTEVSVALQVYFTTLHFTVRSFDKAHVIDLGMYAKRRDQTNVRTFRCFDGTQTAVVAIVYVTNFEAGALAGQTAWSEGRDTTLVRDLRQRVGLVKEL